MEKIFVLIALTFVGIFQQADATAVVTYTDLEEFNVIFLQFAGEDGTLDFGELMLMTGRRIMKYYELQKKNDLEIEDYRIYDYLLQRLLQTILDDFITLASEDMKISATVAQTHWGTDPFVKLFGGTALDL